MRSHPSINTNRVVVALLDGRRLKGYVFDFVPAGKSLNVFPSCGDPGDRRPATVVEFAACKAIFFVRSHLGDRKVAAEAREVSEDPRRRVPRGKKVRVVFSDGEEMTCCTEVYNPKRFGFFVYPLDPRSNNLRIFVVNSNVMKVMTAKTVDASPNRPPVEERVARIPPSASFEEKGPDPDLKYEVALRILEGEDPADLEKEYGLSTDVLTAWTREFLKGGRDALSGTVEPAMETLLNAFRGRIRDLEKELERAKKGAAKVLLRT